MDGKKARGIPAALLITENRRGNVAYIYRIKVAHDHRQRFTSSERSADRLQSCATLRHRSHNDSPRFPIRMNIDEQLKGSQISAIRRVRGDDATRSKGSRKLSNCRARRIKPWFSRELTLADRWTPGYKGARLTS